MGQQEDGGGNYLPFLSSLLLGPPSRFQTWLLSLPTSGRSSDPDFPTTVLVISLVSHRV